MNETLARWISDAEALRYTLGFRSTQVPTWLSNIQQRSEDYYISLVGELYEHMREPYEDRSDWARLANALAHFANEGVDRYVNAFEARLFAAGAFYIGGFPASAYLTMRESENLSNDADFARCEDFLFRPATFQSDEMKQLLDSLRLNRIQQIRLMAAQAEADADAALDKGPDAWIPARLYQLLLEEFSQTNLRAVLPQRERNYWLPLIKLFLSQSPPRCEFFPSQIEAINRGLLESSQGFSLQMPTGAGKTTLSEVLFFDHLKSNHNSVAVLLVPYRSLAAELKKSLVRNMGRLGFRSTAIYGGTVPVGEEAASLEKVRVLVATPEALSGLLSASPAFFERITLLAVDEGHLLDSDSRGVCLELILSRFRARKPNPPRFVFLSAIVPNIEEINAWLGGNENTVVRSEYRPAIAEFATLRLSGKNTSTRIDLEVNAAEEEPFNYRVDRFLDRSRFSYSNPETGRANTYKFTSVKTQAIATARMALPMGTCAVFATQKTGNQGAIALAEEVMSQLEHPLGLPDPAEFADNSRQAVEEYLDSEYGDDWIGTRIVGAGGAMHHGDIPQETREVIEKLIREKVCRLIICTSTLAEGVNLPVRTLVLYSVVRRTGRERSAMLLRDIKNLVGRAGRPGSNTKGLVICVNESDWATVAPIAREATVEPVHGALAELLSKIIRALARSPTIEELTNEILEANTWLHALVDGVDATLIELAAQELGMEKLQELANEIAEQSFAATQTNEDSIALLKTVFQLRSEAITQMQANGKLAWARSTGARPRMIGLVEEVLLPRVDDWTALSGTPNTEAIDALLDWAFGLSEVDGKLREAYRIDDGDATSTVHQQFRQFVKLWIAGDRFVDIASQLSIDVNQVLRIYSGAFSYAFQTVAEQGIAVLAELLEARLELLPESVKMIPEYLRHGVPEESALRFAMSGVRHRRAAIDLGRKFSIEAGEQNIGFEIARAELNSNYTEWLADWGELMLTNTLNDLDDILDS